MNDLDLMRCPCSHASYTTDFWPEYFNESVTLMDLKQPSVVIPRAVSGHMSPFSTDIDKKSEVRVWGKVTVKPTLSTLAGRRGAWRSTGAIPTTYLTKMKVAHTIGASNKIKSSIIFEFNRRHKRNEGSVSIDGLTGAVA